jgi:general nucleoside transport system permease protein
MTAPHQAPLLRRMSLAAAAPVSAALLALVFSSIILIISGSNPLTAWGDMLSYGSRLETIVDALNRATPLYLSGIAGAIAFRMNLFNIGVEGQYILAAFMGAYVGGQINLPAPLHVATIMLTAMIVGALWAALAGLLKVTRGVDVVIATIMLNFLAISGLVAFMLPRLQEESDSLTTATKAIPSSGQMPNLNGVLELVTREIIRGRELTGMFAVAIAVGIIYHLFVNRTRLGYDLRASGINPEAARASGVPPKRMIMLSMALSGAVAGLVGMPEILSDSHKYDDAFIQKLGFAGIAVALLGRLSPWGIAAAALLFGFLDASGVILDANDQASREVVVIMQGVILLAAVIAYQVVTRYRARQEAADATAALLNEAEATS